MGRLRYLVVLVAVIGVVGVAVAVVGGGDDEDRQVQAACGESGRDSFKPVTGMELRDPLELESQGGTLSVDLRVTEQKTSVSGTGVTAKVYDGPWAVPSGKYGLFVGPTLRVKPGDTLIVNLDNRLDEPTNLHFHGMHVSPKAPGDDVFIHVMPGDTYRYELDIPSDHNPGTFWYHSHQHGSAEEQVFGGLSGTIVVEGDEADLPKALQGLPERVFALKDLQVGTNGAILDQGIDSNKPTHRTVNGLVEPNFGLNVGRPELWRFANIGADIWYLIDLTDLDARVVNEDGNPVTSPRPEPSELLLPPGKRYDVIVRPDQVGTWELKTLQYRTGPDGDCYPETELASALVGVGPEGKPLPERVAVRGPKPPTPDADPPIDFTATFTEDDNGFYINGKQFDPNRPPDVTVPVNTTQTWLLQNETQEQHPFHLHVDDFTVLSINGEPYPATSQQDTVPLPIGTPEDPGQVVISIPFDRYTGEFVFHCHILAHEDGGMMATVMVE